MSADELIAQLTAQHQPVSLRRFRRLLGYTGVMILASLFAVGMLYGLRSDIAYQLNNPLVAGEVVANIMLILSAAYAACVRAYPDRNHSLIVSFVMLLSMALYTVFLMLQTKDAGFAYNDHLASHHVMQCFLCIMSFAIIPSVFMVWQIRKLAPVKLSQLAVNVMLMAMGIGLLGVRIVSEESMSIAHAIWHIIPVFLGIAAALLLGQKIFRW
jgi:hypothetical protein